MWLRLKLRRNICADAYPDIPISGDTDVKPKQTFFSRCGPSHGADNLCPAKSLSVQVHVSFGTAGVCGWLANALDCKSDGQGSTPGCDRVKYYFCPVLPNQHLSRLVSGFLAHDSFMSCKQREGSELSVPMTPLVWLNLFQKVIFTSCNIYYITPFTRHLSLIHI